MAEIKAELVVDHRCLLGESPVWDPLHKCLLWVDILKGEIHFFYPLNKEHRVFTLDATIGAIAIQRGGGLVAAIKGGFAIVDPGNRGFQMVAAVETDLPGNRFNDGKCDPAGRFFAGTMSVENEPNAGTLYSLEKDLTVTAKLPGIGCSNGLAWSPDHKTFYFIDTLALSVSAFDYEVMTGTIKNRREVIRFLEEDGYPDGMTIDREGMLWIALWGGGRIGRYDPSSGRQLFEIALPVSQVTSCIFGGDDWEDLYITSACLGLSEAQLVAEPFAGSVFVVKGSGYQGTPAFFYDSDATI